MKKLTSVVFTAVAVAAAFSASGVLGADFAKTRSYESFKDVPQNAWYYSDVVSAYELNLVNGMGEGEFSPDGSMTVAQGITLAARMNVIYNGKESLTQTGANWYDVYVDYAKQNGFLTDGQFDDFNRPIKRSEMVALFAAALPKDFFEAKNTVVKIPDVKANASFYDSLLTLYKAGVVMGSDEFGTFNPEANIKRSEVSAIINRIAIKDNRLSKLLTPKTETKAAELCYSTTVQNRFGGLTSGWSFDNQGGSIKTSETAPYPIMDYKKDFGSALVRDLTYINGGTVNFEGNIDLIKGFDGFVLQFNDKDEKIEYQLVTKDNSFMLLLADGSYKKLCDAKEGVTDYAFKIILNLDNKKCETFINFVSYGVDDLLADGIINFRYASTEEGIITYSTGMTKINKNYSIFEDLELYTEDIEKPIDWQANAVDGKAKIENKEFVLSGKSSFVKSFNAISGKMSFETIFIQPKHMNTAFEIYAGDTAAVKVETKGGKLFANGKELRSYLENIWYTLRIEADCTSGKAVIKLAGKVCGEVELLADVPSFNKAVILAADESAEKEMRFDNVKAYELYEYADYISAPVKPQGEEAYNIGMNICSLWRNEVHRGWDCISPYDEIKPLLGYYDEGIPEVADWENKWMAEHGIDFQLFCWYATETNAPLKVTAQSSALQDGYFNSKYGEYTKFALLWEASNASHPAGSEAFRKHFVPYWKEYFFSDERYMTIDNKLVMGVFGPTQLVKDFGSEAAVKAEFDYLRAEAKKMGFDGMIIIACHPAAKILADCGFDASYAYNWGKQGYELDYTKERIQSGIDSKIIHVVPTISTGFNNVGWAQTRSPNMSVDDFKAVNTWVRDEILGNQYKNKSENWQKTFVMMSTWNEYGEGTYMAPSGLNEFGYLDAIREVYTKGAAHTDEKPNEKQLERMNYLYPNYRSLIRPLWKEVTLENDYPTESLFTLDFQDPALINSFAVGSINIEAGSVPLRGTTTTNDPILAWKGKTIDIPCADISHIKIRAKGISGNMFEIFFSTDRTGVDTWTAQASTRANYTSNEMKDYYVDVSKLGTWNGILKQIRFDPLVTADSEFELESIQLMKKKSDVNYYINGVAQKAHVLPVKDNGNTMLAFNPENAMHYKLNSFYSYNKTEGKLTIKANHKTVVFTVGSDKALVDGKEEALGSKVYLADGLPMLPIEKFASFVGYTTEDKDGLINIKTNQADIYDRVANRKENEWNFDDDGDTEGWNSGNMSLLAFDKNLMGVISEGVKDPILMSPKITLEAMKYNKIEISLKHEYDKDENDSVGFYFITDANPTWIQKQYVGAPITKSSNGEYIKYLFDMSANEYWKSNVTQLRFDPYNSSGTFELDYIKLYEDPDYEKKKNAPTEFINGTADDEKVTLYNENSEITIVNDPKNAGNKCFKVVSKITDKETWNYARQDMIFKRGKKYVVEFDVMIDEAANGAHLDKAIIYFNMRYRDDAGKVDHPISSVVANNNSWTHYKSVAIEMNPSSNTGSDQFSIFANPENKFGVNFYLDNLKIYEVE